MKFLPESRRVFQSREKRPLEHEEGEVGEPCQWVGRMSVKGRESKTESYKEHANGRSEMGGGCECENAALSHGR